ncbi:glycosyl transferase [Thiopseudomonas acetoxidans]|uniref:Glycosyl transferase n=1 Tax=Thiopseudomonas acetoxidans TaxID=3041622 RepID=A0ABT7SMX8_9GAMM|nr:glycosyl transferase [Thiopseudomonas sp. CY1220]MDM7857543.1 glycosyl transferase [Thiopseudomonas sp. CY1220]
MNAKTNTHWASQSERGSFWLMKLTLLLTRIFGRRLVAPLLYMIVFYFFVTGRVARKSINTYYANLAQWSGRDALKPTLLKTFRQFMSFAQSILDKFDVWHGRLGLQHLDVDDPHAVRQQTHMQQGRGQILVGAHLGNLEVCRALAEVGKKVRMNVLVHTTHAQQINRLLNESGASNLRLIQVSELDAATMLQLNQRIDEGEWLAIAGDRVPLQDKRLSLVQFLGQPAYLPQGPWLLAGLLQCRVNLFFCLKTKGRYRICLEPFAQRIEWQRHSRQKILDDCAQQFADRLALRCLEAPDQWFNFYPFWNTDEQ